MRQVPRLFVAAPLAAGITIDVDPGQAHYLAGVLRLAAGAAVLLCDDATGEWAATVASADRRRVSLHVGENLRPREAAPDLWLCAAPIKAARWEWLAEKACELGVARLVPVLTERTVVRNINPVRLRAHMVEAAEQCGRTALPVLGDATPLAALLAAWPVNRVLVFADEAGGAAAATLARCPAPAAIIIGPEGGFSAAERAAIRAVAGAHAITLGPRILRADTAAVAAIAVWQAAHGS
jgi:16S rRNA (uracil1498-N3)-methyltransferase